MCRSAVQATIFLSSLVFFFFLGGGGREQNTQQERSIYGESTSTKGIAEERRDNDVINDEKFSFSSIKATCLSRVLRSNCPVKIILKKKKKRNTETKYPDPPFCSPNRWRNRSIGRIVRQRGNWQEHGQRCGELKTRNKKKKRKKYRRSIEPWKKKNLFDTFSPPPPSPEVFISP